MPNEKRPLSEEVGRFGLFMVVWASFKYASIILTLEAAMGNEVDLVQEGTLLPFAAKTAEKDKILIYERAN